MHFAVQVKIYSTAGLINDDLIPSLQRLCGHLSFRSIDL